MWWSISGLVLQLVAGFFLALPYISPGLMEKVNEEWHSGRGKQWLVIVIWAIMGIALLTVGGLAIYSDSTSRGSWFEKLFGVILGAAFAFVVYQSIVKWFSERLRKRLPKWLQQSKIGSGIRYQKLVAANLRTFVWSTIGFVVLTSVSYVIYVTLLSHSPSSLWFLILLLLVIFVDAFCLTTALLAISFIFLDKVTNAINVRVEKPVWTYVLSFFVIGCLLQIVGAVLKGKTG